MERRKVALEAKWGKPDPEVAWVYYEVLHEMVLTEVYDQTKAALAVNSPDAQLYACLPTLLHWRMTRGFYSFDETLREALAETPMDKIPVDVLRRLPEYAPYIELNGYNYAGKQIHGAWVMYGLSKNKVPQLNVVLHHGSDDVIGCILDLCSSDLTECLDLTAANSLEGMEDYFKQIGKTFSLAERMNHMEMMQMGLAEDRKLYKHLLPLMLYLCADEPDVTGVVKAPQPSNKRKYAHTYVVPQTDNMLQVGFKAGGAIRMWRQNFKQRTSESSGAGMPKQSFIRRAHWHLYWTGKGRTEPKIKWIAATPVNVKNLDNVPVHMRPVLDDPADGREAKNPFKHANPAVLDRLK